MRSRPLARPRLLAALALAGGLAALAPAAHGAVALPSSPYSGPSAGAPPKPSGSSAATRNQLELGSRGSAVRALQRALRKRGMRVAVDGVYGPGTRAAVKKLQKSLRRRQTGVADAVVLRKLGVSLSRSVAAPRSSGKIAVFPVRGEYTYSNDWGAPRGQGSHQGNDIMADRGTPLVAADNGVISKISRAEQGLGGIYVWIRRADGVQYYYAHMHTIAAGLELGTRVSAGQMIGTVGNTGDARYGAPHLHFEIRNDWTPINPYPHLRSVDPNAGS